jgi:ribosomal protein S18 acetylase RimI-like enzyme
LRACVGGARRVVTEPRTLRRATLGDARAIVELVESAYRGEPSRAGWTTEADLLDGQRTDLDEVREFILDPAARLTLAEEGTSLIGCIGARIEDDGAHLGLFAVRPDRQAHRIGRALLEEAERVARDELGANTAVLHVLHTRSELLAWYERRGYRDSGRRAPFQYGNPRVGLPKVDGLEFRVLTKEI